MNRFVVTVTLNPALDKTVILPRLQIGGLNRVRQMRQDPGGKGINVAKVLNQFGVDVKATGLMAGAQGRWLVKQLEEQGISVDFLEVSGETRTNLKIYDEQTRITTEINDPGFTVHADDLHRFREKLADLLQHAAVLVVGGSLPPGAPDHIYRDYIEMANERGVRTVLDADGTPLRQGILAKPFAVKPNLFELQQWMGRKLDSEAEIVAAGRELLQQGVSLVAISMGGDGSLVMDADAAYRVFPFSITPQSTVGAGDSMVAALVYSLLTGKSLRETAIWGTAAGTVTASKFGTQVCTLEEVENSIARVHVVHL
ncbi:1-phosphofructokinase [Effusibacillus pohliae]|uniref:1-phosphofructokinase n=1 Tax=Effusibacillus pohliae TaxID=232270 RepID=UPI000365547F|nr:1-phosphofructokinase [Effusibacillus pohliae]